MLEALLIIHLLIAVALVATVLLQRSEGGALGMGGSGGGMGGFLTGRGTANLLTRTTAILAGLFIVTSLTLARLSGGHHVSQSIFDAPVSGAPAAPETPAAPEAPAAPADSSATPAAPTVPLAR